MICYGVCKIIFKEVGKLIFGVMKIWMDEVSGCLNKDECGIFLGVFDIGDLIFVIYIDGSYEFMELDLNKKFEFKEFFYIGKYDEEQVVLVIYYEGECKWSMVKWFNIEIFLLE